MLAYLALFLAAFLAATVFPAQSEAVVVAMLLGGKAPLAVVAIASLGNVLGAMTTWALGYWAEPLAASWARRGQDRREQDRRGKTLPLPDLRRARAWYHRWGRLTLLLSWLPLIGDALVLVAGLAREPALPVLLLITCAKTARYAVLAALTLNLFGA